MSNRIAIIGAGAAGLMAAGTAAAQGAQVVVIDKNRRAGQKLLITGKGRCNVTNQCDDDTLMANIPGNGRFLYSVFSTFSPEDIMHFFEKHHVPMKTERGNRVFPVSDKASDVVQALTSYVLGGGGRFMLDTQVQSILVNDGHVTGVRYANGTKESFNKVMIATGGLSYPATGSTGDGYRMAEVLGHKVVPPMPSLVPLETKENWVSELSGLSLKNVSLTIYNAKNKTVYHEMGEMLFTHFGISGPMVLSASRHLLKDNFSGYRAEIDLKPALDDATLDRRLQRDFDKYANKQFKNALGDLMPSSLIPVMVKLTGISEDKFVHQVSREERMTLLQLLKHLPLTISGARPVEEAIITAGGISVKEVNPATMASKLVEGLYFGGEVLDVDAYTGGFNLTIAFSTGYAAGLAMGQ